MKKRHLIAMLLVSLSITAKSQEKELKVGEPMPDFELNEVHYFNESKIVLGDLKGKWFLLDFFTQNCIACFQSFPKMNKIQKEFKDKIQLVLIGDNEHKYGKNVKEIFERVRNKQGLDLTVAYDSVTFKRWNITAVPYVVVVDDKGIIRAINNSQDINSPNLKALLERKDVSSNFRSIDYESWDVKKPFLIGGNGGPDTAYSFRSILGNWERPTPFISPKSITAYIDLIDRLGGRRGYQASGIPLQMLYNIAYFNRYTIDHGDSLYGITTRLPLFEKIDSSKFAPNSKTGKNIYNYSLTVPTARATTSFIQEVMKRDLKNYFGFKTAFERRKMPYWKLTVTKDAHEKLKTKGGAVAFENYGAAGFKAANYSMKSFISVLLSYHQTIPPIIDETGIMTNIDIKFDALLTDFNDVKRELKTHGLDLVQGTKLMKVLVISDPKNEKAKLIN